jgi:hypothetical protein
MKLRKTPTDHSDSPPNAATAANGCGDALAVFLRRSYVGPRQFHKALSLWPLLPTPGAAGPNGLDYVPLADALEDGFSGHVPHVRVENRAATAVLILFGEELRGAKQNRVANASFLLPPREERVIDVSCVEQGRWGAGAAAAAASPVAAPSSKAARRCSRAPSGTGW